VVFGVARASCAWFTGGTPVPLFEPASSAELPGEFDELGELPDDLSFELMASCGRALSRPSLGKLDQIRRQALLSASDATAPPAIVQKLRLFMRARMSFIV